MGLVSGFVLAVDRRFLFAVGGVAMSIGYALIAGAAVGGLKDAQAALAAGLQDTDLVATRPDGAPFLLDALPAPPDHAISEAIVNGTRVYVDRGALATSPGPGNATTGPVLAVKNGERFILGNSTVTVVGTAVTPGASPWGLALDPVNATQLDVPDTVAVATFENASGGLRDELRDAGFASFEAPATLEFYTRGADQLARTVSFSVAASTLVVGLLAGAFIRFEFKARERSFATLRFYAGPNLVSRIVALRGLALLVTVHGLALAGTLVALAVLKRAQAIRLALPPGYAAGAMLATILGGLLSIALVVVLTRRRLRATELQIRAPARRAAFLRPILVGWSAAIPLALAALVTSASLGVAFGVADIPFQIFGQADSSVIAAPTGNPLRGSVDEFLGLHLDEAEGYLASSPEIFAPTSVRGEPVMVRGVDWQSLTRLQDMPIIHGRPAEARGEAVLGALAARRLDLGVGEAFLAPASYHEGFVRLHVVGIARSGEVLDDSVLVTLDTARDLTGLPLGRVNLIRYEIDPAYREERGEEPPVPFGIAITGLTLSVPRPLAGQEVHAQVSLVNFADTATSRTLTLRVNGVPVADTVAHLGRHASDTVELPFRAPPGNRLVVEVNPQLETDAEEPAYRVGAPERGTTNAPFRVTVSQLDGSPAADIFVTVGETQTRTAADGTASLTAPRSGNQSILVQGPSGRGVTTILIVDPGDEDTARLRFSSFVGPDQSAPGPWRGTVTLENVGGAPFSGDVPLDVDGTLVNTTTVALGPGAAGRIEVELPLAEGVHAIRAGTLSLTVTVHSAGVPDDDSGVPPTLAELLQKRREASRAFGPAAKEPVEAFLGDTYENFNVALTVIVLASILHGGLVMFATVERELTERSVRVGTLLAMGADRSAVRLRALRDYALVAGVGVGAGTLLGLGVVWAGAQAGLLSGFGHALVPRTSAGFMIRLWIVNLALVVGLALLAADRARSRTVQELLTEGPARSRRPPLNDLLESAR